jgi:hypothetical protein
MLLEQLALAIPRLHGLPDFARVNVPKGTFDSLLDYGQESEIEIRQIFELEEFGEGPAVDRARELEKELGEKKK